MAGATVKINQIIQRTYNVKSFRLEPIEKIDFKAGQFLCVHLLTEDACKRYLSISSSPTEKGYIEFTKKITQSDFSVALDSASPGDKLKIEYPFGKFTLEEDCKKIAFLSGGIGITPIRSICKYVADKNSGIDIILLYANQAVNDIVFKEDFDMMQRGYPKLKVVHVLSEGASEFKSYTGRINSQIIKAEIPNYAERKFYLCGPPGMVEAMKKILRDELSVALPSIITENFVGY